MESEIIPASDMKNIIPETSDQYWATLRHKGGGPEYIKVGPRKVYYRLADVEAWLEGNRYTRTDRPVSA
jgi:hypothetical protein